MTSPSPHPPLHAPPHPWYRLVRLSFQQLLTWAVTYYTFSVIQVPMRGELGWEPALISAGFSLTLLLYALSGPFLGRLYDRFGTWGLMLAGAAGGFTSLYAWSLVHTPGAYLLIMSLLGVCMAACLYEPAFYLVAKWFPARRAPALTLLTFFGALASPIFLPVTERLVAANGWRDALRTLSLGAAVIVIPLLLSLPRQHHRQAKPPSGHPLHMNRVLRSGMFWKLQTGFILISITAIALPVNLIPHLVAEGQSLRFAAECTGSIAFFGIIGRLSFGRAGDGRGLDILSTLFFALMTLGIAALFLVPLPAGAYVFAGIFGLGYGALWPSRAALAARAWSGPTFATLAGIFALGPNLAKAASPLFSALLARHIGLENTFLLLSPLPLIGAALIWSARAPRSN